MKRTLVFAVALLCVVVQIAACLAADPPKTGEKRDTLIYVRSDPPGAKVLVDGKELGRTNGLFPVDAGVATVILELKGHAPVTKQVTIQAEGITRIEIELKPQTPPADEDQSYAVATSSGNDNAENYWTKYKRWAGYQKGADGVEKNPQKARELLTQLVKRRLSRHVPPDQRVCPKNTERVPQQL